jgi:hypothetical protein
MEMESLKTHKVGTSIAKVKTAYDIPAAIYLNKLEPILLLDYIKTSKNNFKAVVTVNNEKHKV